MPVKEPKMSALIHVGAVFPSRDSVKETVALACALESRGCRFPDNNRNKVTARCPLRDCAFVVRARRHTADTFRITSCNTEHSCRPGSASTNAALVRKIARDQLKFGGRASSFDVITRARVDYGIEIQYKKAYKSLKTVTKSSRENSERSYGMIEPWLQELQQANPGSVVDVTRLPNHSILRVFLSLGPWIDSAKSCLPVMSLDVTSLNCADGGILFLASVLSPNRDIVIVAVGVGMTEDTDHWEWFVSLLKRADAFSAQQDAVVISDRENGLATAVRRKVPDIPHSYCSYRIKKSVEAAYDTDLDNTIQEIAKSLTPQECDDLMDAVKHVSPAAEAYLSSFEKENWVTCFVPRPRFGQVATNITETNNNWVQEEQTGSWFSSLQAIVRKLQTRAYSKRLEYASMEGDFVPWVAAKVKTNMAIGRQRRVVRVTGDIVEVARDSTRTHAIVTISLRNCSCNFWREYQYPCVHACAALLFVNRDPCCYIADYYRVDRLKRAYKHYGAPMESVYVEPDNTRPPDVERRRGRPGTADNSAYVNGESPVHCSLCGQEGHNRRTCVRRQSAPVRPEAADSAHVDTERLGTLASVISTEFE
ncbi:hypothetical protein Poli38472_009563 [Pythium oligandrum]|uniref:SWIM-type domain-containing protein n=1 Tax=Pythium oligandrum TaxID=41045 RepID=A0A8K1FFU9_PYTOL|nr:hypothetical protein Poli38472_009563 [Pythium oligandrum]|eukprot:TMW62070.1 hypothetical protein Poli38472_009563 [Pythium oligandrum]